MPAAPVDPRAQVFSNLGPVISGQLSDDPLEIDVGLLRTTGEVVINGLIQPAKGTEIKLGVVLPGGRLTRFPRRLRVIKAESDPCKNQTTLQVGCLLALKWDYVKPEIYQGAQDPQWTPIEVAAGATPHICHLRNVVDLCLTRCEITQATGNPVVTRAKAVSSIDLSDGYLEIASRSLAESGLYGFIDAGEKLRVRSVLTPRTTGPLLSVEDTITIEAIGDPSPPDEIRITYGQSILPSVDTSANYKPRETTDDTYTWNTGS